MSDHDDYDRDDDKAYARSSRERRSSHSEESSSKNSYRCKFTTIEISMLTYLLNKKKHQANGMESPVRVKRQVLVKK